MDIATLGIKIDSTGATKAVTDLDKLTGAAVKAEGATAKVGVASVAASAGMSKGAYQSRMMAQQLSQVAQQSMATGNFVQALAIQLPDMALGFGAVGIAAGVVAGVALPLLASAFTGTSSKATDLTTAIGDLEAAQSGLVATADILGMSIMGLYEKYGLYALNVRNAAAALAELQVAQAQAGLADTLLASADALGRYSAGLELVGMTGRALIPSQLQTMAAVKAISDEMGVSQASAQSLAVAFRDVQQAASFEDRVQALSRLDAVMKQAGVSAAQLPAELRKALIEARQAEIKTAELKRTMDLAAAAASAIGRNVPQAGWLDGAISGAATLASTLWDAAAARAAATATVGVKASATTPGQGVITTPGTVDMGQNSSGAGRINLGMGKGGAGGASGGGGTDDFASRLKTLQDELMTEKQVVDEWYAESQKVLADRRAMELLGEQGHRDAVLAIEKSYQEQMAEIQAQAQQQRLGDAAGFFGVLGDIASSGGKRMVKAVAAAEAIQGTINAYGAAIKALNTPGITLWGRIAAYGSVLAAGLKGVSAIRSAGGIGGGGGGGTAAQGAATGASAPQATLSIAGLGRDRSYTGSELEQIFDGILDVAKVRGMSMPGVVFV